jgi:hypothetical protein
MLVEILHQFVFFCYCIVFYSLIIEAIKPDGMDVIDSKLSWQVDYWMSMVVDMFDVSQ